MIQHQCTKCGKTKDDSDFYHHIGYGRDGRMKHCKLCHYEMNKKWVARNMTSWRKYTNQYSKIWRREHPERARKTRTKAARKLRELVLRHYSGDLMRCACCGESHVGFLSIDHVNNDGAKHRKAIGISRNSSGLSVYSWLKKNNFPLGFQVLCMNCNCGKAWNGGVCPHKTFYVSGIDPEIGKGGDPDVAMAWKFGLTLESYQTLSVES